MIRLDFIIQLAVLNSNPKYFFIYLTWWKKKDWRLTTSDQDNNLFLSVIEAVWYSVVSLTTIGYGDIAPTTLLGRLFGSACAVCGALMVSLPMTIVVEIFTNFYKHLGARSKLPKQRRRVLPVEAPRTRKKQQTQNQDQQKWAQF